MKKGVHEIPGNEASDVCAHTPTASPPVAKQWCEPGQNYDMLCLVGTTIEWVQTILGTLINKCRLS